VPVKYITALPLYSYVLTNPKRKPLEESGRKLRVALQHETLAHLFQVRGVDPPVVLESLVELPVLIGSADVRHNQGLWGNVLTHMFKRTQEVHVVRETIGLYTTFKVKLFPKVFLLYIYLMSELRLIPFAFNEV